MTCCKLKLLLLSFLQNNISRVLSVLTSPFLSFREVLHSFEFFHPLQYIRRMTSLLVASIKYSLNCFNYLFCKECLHYFKPNPLYQKALCYKWQVVEFPHNANIFFPIAYRLTGINMAVSQGVFSKAPAKGRSLNPLLLLFTVTLLSAAFKPYLCDFLLLSLHCDKPMIDSFHWQGWRVADKLSIWQ